jgi:hypothetical protein
MIWVRLHEPPTIREFGAQTSIRNLYLTGQDVATGASWELCMAASLLFHGVGRESDRCGIEAASPLGALALDAL